jgi:WD40 repeat protein
VDREDIPPAARWRQELIAAIEAADAVVVVISPDWVSSPYCAQELEHAVESGKRIVPVLRRPAEGVPEELASRQWVPMREEDPQGPALDTLVRAIDTDLDWVRGHTRYLEEATRWSAEDRDRSLLLRGSDLRAAEEWLTAGAGRREPRPTELQTSLIHSSRRAATRRLQILAGAVAAALVVSVGLTIFSLVQRSQAIDRERTARAGELAAGAREQLAVDPERSLLLALRAVDSKPTRQAQAILRQAAFDSLVRETYRGGGPLYDAAFSPDDRRIAAAGADGTVRVWTRGAGGDPVVLRGSPGDVGGVAFAPEGRRVAGATVEGVRVWPAAGGASRLLAAPELLAGGLAWSADGRRIASGGKQGGVVVWTLGSDRKPLVLRGHRGRIDDVAFDPVSGRLASAGADGDVRLWDRRGRSTVLHGHRGAVHAVAFSPDGRNLASGGEDGTVRLWDLVGSARPLVMPGHRRDVLGVAFSPDGRWVVSAGADETVRVWDRAAGRQVAVLRGHRGLAWSAQFDHGGRAVVSASQDGTARVWEWTGERAALPGSGTARVGAAGFTPDGRSVVAVDARAVARVWRLGRSDAPPRVTHGPAGRLAALSPDRERVANVSGGRAQVWERRRPDRRTVLREPEPLADVGLLGFSPDGARVAGALEAGGAAIWPGLHGLPVEALPLGPDQLDSLWSVAFSPDASRVAGGGESGTIYVWDRPGSIRPRTLPGNGGLVLGLAFSPDGASLASASDDGVVRVWDLAAGRPEAVLRGHDGRVLTVAFSPDGRLLASGGQDGTVRVWDWTDTGTALVLHGTRGSVQTVAFSPDGRRIVSAGDDGGVRVWRCDVCVPLGALERVARREATRELTPEELEGLTP